MDAQDRLTAAQLRQGILDALADKGIIGATWLPAAVAKANGVEYVYDNAMYAKHPFDQRVMARARAMADEGVIRRTEPGKRLANGRHSHWRRMNVYYSIERYDADQAALAERKAAEQAEVDRQVAANEARHQQNELQAAGQVQLRRMIAAYSASEAAGSLSRGMTLLQFLGLTSEELAQWVTDGRVSDRWLRAANTRHLTGVKQ